MKPLRFLLLLGGWATTQTGMAQDAPTTCVAAHVGNRMVVDEYTTKGKCRLATTATGELAVFTVDLSPTENKALDKVDFHVAIRDKETGTLRSFSEKTYRQVPVQQVLARCKPGDHIVLLTVEGRYALPHNEITVQ